MEFRPSTPEDLPAIRELLAKAFNVPPDAPLLHEEMLRWKYFAPRADSEAKRSFLLVRGGVPVAHGCAWPPSPFAEARRSPAACLLDWVSSGEAPGMGVALFRLMAQHLGSLLSIGGSESTRNILPRLGAGECGTSLTYARVLRAGKQWRTRPSGNPGRNAARWLRNMNWSRARNANWQGWHVSPANSELFAYWVACPGVRVAPYELRQNGELRGDFVLSHVRGQVRICALRLFSGEAEEWTAAFALALDTAMLDEEACEVVALGSHALATGALLANNFRPRVERPIFVYNTSAPISGPCPPLYLDMFDDDAAFLDVPDSPYVT